jgi:thiol-disulfide isomerase/thioredoxin
VTKLRSVLPSSLVSTLIVALLVTAACDGERGSDLDGAREVAPTFELPQLDGAPLRLEDLRGRIVILDFWATWCAPCEVQMPVLDELWRDTNWRDDHGDDLMIIGVSVDTDPVSEVAAWVDERGFEYPIVVGDQDLAMRYGVFGFPTLVVIDHNGGIFTRHTGVWSRSEIEDVLGEVRPEAQSDG